MYVTFPSTESKIFTLIRGHAEAILLSQIGSRCDIVNQEERGQIGLTVASKINDGIGSPLLQGGVRT